MSDIDREETRSMAQMLKDAIDARLLEVHTAMPAAITSYDRGTNLAIVQPLLKRKYVDEDAAVNLPTISNVRVMHPTSAGGSAHVRLPIKTGDEGQLVFNERSIDLWLEEGGLVDPEDNRRFSLSDAVFYPGLTSKGNVLSSAGGANSLELKNDKMLIEMLPSGKVKIKNTLGASFLTQFDQLLTSLLGEPFIVNKGTISTIKALHATLKG